MPDPMEPQFTAQNPIVAAAEKIRARRELGKLIDASTGEATRSAEDADESFAMFAAQLAQGVKRLNSILGPANSVKLIRLERPLRLRLRFGEKRIALDLDDVQQLVRVSGDQLDGEYQFDPESANPALINLSIISTDAHYGERLTASTLLKHVAQDAELPRPEHLDRSGPIQF
jgi:hypothetical protein